MDRRGAGWAAAAIAMCGTAGAAGGQTLPDTAIESEGGVRFRLETIVTGVETPSALAFLPDGRLLLAERPAGRLSIVDVASREVVPVEGLPAVFGALDAGLHDVVVSPTFADDHLLYLSWSVGDSLASALEVARARLEGSRLVEVTRLFRAEPARDTAYHYGGRLLLDGPWLFVTVGEHHHRWEAQDLGSHLGKVIRIRSDGRLPGDNPFTATPDARPEIWTLGHRNPQGMARDPRTGEIWIDEHGPLGGDELNLLRRGANYGWPLVSWGIEYDGAPVGDGRTHAVGVEQPVFVFERRTAPSDLFFYTGDAFPRWRGNLFGGAMGRARRLVRIVLERGRVLHEEGLLRDLDLRFRAVEQGPDGFIYVGVDEGVVFRMVPDAGPAR